MEMRRGVRGCSRSVAPMLAVLLGLASALPAGAAPFVHPFYVAVDSAGNIYVTEPERHRVQKFDATGAFVTQWGTRGSGNGQFDSPEGIAVDTTGNVYVADYRNSRIQKFTTAGVFVAKWTVPGVQPTPLQRPIAVAVDGSGSVYVTASAARRVQVFSGAGAPLRSWGPVLTGVADGRFSQFQAPAGIAVDPAGFVYVADTGNHRVQKFDANGTFVGWAGRCSSGTNCDVSNQRSKGFQCSAATCSAPSSGSGDGQFLLPSGLTVDPTGNLYVADTSNHRIQVFDAGGFKTKWGTNGVAPGQVRSPIGAAADGAGNVIVADTGNDRIQRFGPGGTATQVWGPDVRVASSRGESPGNVNPIIVGPSSSTQSYITVESVNQFGGPVNLKVLCCQNWETSVGPAPSGVTVTLSTNSITVPANGSATAILEVAATSAPASGKYIATVNASNAGLGISRDVSVVFTVTPPAGADLTVSASPGQSPGIPDLSPPQTATSTITVQPISQFSGPVVLSASCCFDVILQRTVSVPGVTFSLSPDRMLLTGNGSQTSTLTLTSSGAPFFGKLLVPVTATSEIAPSIKKSTNVGFTVLPKAEPAPSCHPGPEVLTIGHLVQNLITRKEANPPASTTIIAIVAKTTNDLWKWTIEDDSSLTADEATIVLDNAVGWEKEITTAGCPSAGMTIRAKGGKQLEMKIMKPDSTIILRKPVCTFAFLWCWSTSWRDVAIFAEPAFWRMFGGKKSTLRWVRD
jgi:sugar lactone lactonase YvrE